MALRHLRFVHATALLTAAIGLAGMTTGEQRLSALVCQDRRDAAMGLAPCARIP